MGHKPVHLQGGIHRQTFLQRCPLRLLHAVHGYGEGCTCVGAVRAGTMRVAAAGGEGRLGVQPGGMERAVQPKRSSVPALLPAARRKGCERQLVSCAWLTVSCRGQQRLLSLAWHHDLFAGICRFTFATAGRLTAPPFGPATRLLCCSGGGGYSSNDITYLTQLRNKGILFIAAAGGAAGLHGFLAACVFEGGRHPCRRSLAELEPASPCHRTPRQRGAKHADESQLPRLVQQCFGQCHRR